MLNYKEGGLEHKSGGGIAGSTNQYVLNSVVIQNDASVVLSVIKLYGSNYSIWSKVLEMHIIGRGKKGFVTGNIKERMKAVLSMRRGRRRMQL
ncbi:hypothetical protein TB2_027790 [Malus domestica]